MSVIASTNLMCKLYISLHLHQTRKKKNQSSKHRLFHHLFQINAD